MKKLKRIIASASAAAMAASALLAAVPASAASVEKEIAYTGPSDGALAFENDGSSLRMNIFNEWGIDIKDIENKGDFSEKDFCNIYSFRSWRKFCKHCRGRN